MRYRYISSFLPKTPKTIKLPSPLLPRISRYFYNRLFSGQLPVSGHLNSHRCEERLVLVLRLDRDLQSLPARHLVQSTLVVAERENISDHARGLDLARIEEINGSGETVSLGEGTDDSLLIDEDVGGGPSGETGFVLVDTVDKKCTTSGNVIDSVIDKGFDSSSFSDNVETV